MKLGVHKEALVNSLALADTVYCFEDKHIQWSMKALFAEQGKSIHVETNIDSLVEQLAKQAKPHNHILIMSNGGFGNIHQKLLDKLESMHDL